MYNNFSNFSQRMAAQRRKRVLMSVGVIVVVLLVIATTVCFRFDFASGSHRILPTAVDTDFFGNYKVYYRTTEFTKDSEESVYYISKGNTELAEQMRECVKAGEFIMVYYDSYFGFYGIGAPREAPITRIEILE